MSRRRSPVSNARSRQRSPKSPASLSRPRTATPRARRKHRCSLAAETTWFGVAHATNLNHGRAHPLGVEQRAKAHRPDGRYRRIFLVAAHPGEGRLTQPTTATPAWQREPLFMVESECGAVAVGRTYLLPPLSSGGASLV